MYRDLIVKLAARHKLPAIYYERFFVAEGGLISYGPNIVDQYRRAPGYVDRILRVRSQPTAGTSTDQVRTCDQPQDRQGTQPRRPQHANWGRGPVDRMRWCMSAFGP